MKQFYFLFLVLVCTNVNAQYYKTGTITYNNNQTIGGRLFIDNSEKKVFLKKDGRIQSYNFNNITKVTMSGRMYSKINFENNPLLAHQLENGKASLYELANSDYLMLMKNGSRKLINLEENKAQIPGILGILFNDCNVIRDIIYKSDKINEHKLKGLVSDYNNCDYSDYNPTENEMKNANTYNTDIIRFYGGFQTGFNNTIVNDFDSNNNTGFGLGLGIAASPSFTGKLQGNLYFDFDISMMFTGDNDFDNGATPLNYKVNSYRFSMGLEYLFNKKGIVKPFLGIGCGYSSDHYKGNIGPISFKDQDQNYFFNPKMGLLYKHKNEKHIGVTICYITEYENDLSFHFGEELTHYLIVIDTSAINLSLNYYF